MIGGSIYCNPMKQGYCDLRIVICGMKFNAVIRITHCILPQGQQSIANLAFNYDKQIIHVNK